MRNKKVFFGSTILTIIVIFLMSGSKVFGDNQVKAMTPTQAINYLEPNAQKLGEKYGIYPSVMIAQGVLESGWMGSALSCPPYHNLFGIKGSYNGQYVMMPTWEQKPNGDWYQISAAFAKYPGYYQSMEDNARKLRLGVDWDSSFYRGTWLENAASYKNSTAWLTGRYATALEYGATLNSIIEANNLTRFDPQHSNINKKVYAKKEIEVFNTFSDQRKAVKKVKEGTEFTATKMVKWPTGKTYYQVGNNEYVLSTDATESQEGWRKQGNNWVYLDFAGKKKTGWQTIGGNRYYFNGSGIMLTGWQYIGNIWYYLAGSGEMKKDWQYINNRWYFLSNNGNMLRYWQKIGAYWYYFNPLGQMTTDWQSISGKWYYFPSWGGMSTAWQKISNYWYYMNANGQMETNSWLKLGNKWYYLLNWGGMAEKWQKLGNYWYFFENSGLMHQGWLRYNNSWYYLLIWGGMKNDGWELINGKWYYFDKNGVMKTGWIQDKGKWYFLTSSGALK